MKKFFALIIVFNMFCAYIAPQNTVVRSAITFKVKNLGITVDGSVGGLQATIHFNPQSLGSASIDASVDVKTLSTGNSLRDDHLKSDEFFDVAHYSKILLKSISVRHKSGNKYIGEFNLTIKNKTRAVEIPFTFATKGGLTDFSGSFKINRLDYGLGDSNLILSDEVTISIEAAFRD